MENLMKYLPFVLALLSPSAAWTDSWTINESFKSLTLKEGCAANVEESETIERKNGNIIITFVKRIPVGVAIYPKMSHELNKPEVTINYIAYIPSSAPALCDYTVKLIHTFYSVPDELEFNIAFKYE